MYEQHFGFTKRPFAHNASGGEVFIGPQTATLVQRMARVFAEPDSVVAVTGPVGCGKSTVVARALAALGRPHTVISVGRLKLETDETIEFLLRELGLKQMPAGTIRKIAVFRSLLGKLTEKDVRLVIVVEDANRLGNEALAELEALTAADAGVSNGANIVLMAEESLKPALGLPGLARVSQRTRLHFELRPYTETEVRAYLTHSVRHAGGEFDAVFEDRYVAAMNALSGGIARVINNLATASLSAAADAGETRVSARRLLSVASEEFGIESDALACDEVSSDPLDETLDETSAAAGSADSLPSRDLDALPAGDGNPDDAANAVPEQDSEPTPAALGAESDPADSEPEAAPAAATADDAGVDAEIDAGIDAPTAVPEPAAAHAEASTDDTATNFEIPDLIQDTQPGFEAPVADSFEVPELIQDTLPDLEILSPELAASVTRREDSENRSLPDAADDPVEAATPFSEAPPPDLPPAPEPAVDIPTLMADDADADSDGEDLADWQRDPTLAELKPDLDALEQAMAAAQGKAAIEDEALPVLTPSKELPAAESSGAIEMPQITLDDSIRRKVDLAEAEAAARATAESDAADRTDDDQPESVNDVVVTDDEENELERIAAQLATVKSLEDIDDDKMAETLFGAEISMIAAQVVANPPAEGDTGAAPGYLEDADPTELSLVETQNNLTQNDLTPGSTSAPAASAADTGTQESRLPDDGFRDAHGEESIEVSMETRSNGGMDLSASQRLATVRALNASPGTPPGSNDATHEKQAPQPIEEQINTSITQTLKALDVADLDDIADDEEEPRKNGFFSRFRKS